MSFQELKVLYSQAETISVTWSKEICDYSLVENILNKVRDFQENSKEFDKSVKAVERLFKKHLTSINNFFNKQFDDLKTTKNDIGKSEKLKTTKLEEKELKILDQIEEINLETSSIEGSRHASGKRRKRPKPTENIKEEEIKRSKVEMIRNNPPKRQKTTVKTSKKPELKKEWNRLLRKKTMLEMFWKVQSKILEYIISSIRASLKDFREEPRNTVVSKFVRMTRLKTLRISEGFTFENMPDIQNFRVQMEVEDEGKDNIGYEHDQKAILRFTRVPLVTRLDLNSISPASITKMRLALSVNALSEPISVPVMVAKGRYSGKILCLTSAIHGNELNGIPVIHRLFQEIDIEELGGTIVAIPVLNPSGYLRNERTFSDGKDLNRWFPGKKGGDPTMSYVRSIMDKIVSKVDILIDMHTASFGRVNSFYVRANMLNRTTKEMALLQNPEFIVHNSSPSGSMRGEASKAGVPSITVEIGNPQAFHSNYIRRTLQGIENILCHLDMLPDDAEISSNLPIICSSSYWIWLKHGGVLSMVVGIGDVIKKGQMIGYVRDIFGDLVHEYYAPHVSVIIGKSTNPVAQIGDRLVHLGIIGTTFNENSQDGH